MFAHHGKTVWLNKSILWTSLMAGYGRIYKPTYNWGGHFVVNIYIIIMGIAHQSSDPLLINLYVSKDARHWSSIHDGMTIKRLSQVSHGCPADVHVSNMCHSFKRSFSNYVTCYKRMIYTYIYVYVLNYFWEQFMETHIILTVCIFM